MENNQTDAPPSGVAADTSCSAFMLNLIEVFVSCDSWAIVGMVPPDKVTGDKQECEIFGHAYVDQSGPGICGDDYYGHQYIPIEGQYLKVWYSC